MALKDLISTPGERIASRIGQEWRFSDAEVLARIRDLADKAVAAEREECARTAETIFTRDITSVVAAETIALAIRNRS